MLGLGLLAVAGTVVQAQSPASGDKLHQIMQRSQLSGALGRDVGHDLGRATSATNSKPKTLNPEQSALRNTLLRDAEAALSRRETEQAEVLFDRASNILHSADTEIGLARTYMQAGAYRRALAFGAHTAGVHLDVVGGSALYAWLLQAGGQQAVAQRLLDDTLARQPDNIFMHAVAKQLRSGKPLANAELQVPPTRLAPYGDMKGLPARTRVAGSAVLLSDGSHALTATSLLLAHSQVWVRNGLGQLSPARVQRHYPRWGVTVLALERALPMTQELQSHVGPVFPGAAGYALTYVAHTPGDAAWPLLNIGFIGPPAGKDAQLALGIELKDTSGGGPVLDAAGRLLGIAVTAPGQGVPRLVSTQELQQAGIVLAPPAPNGPAPRAMLDQIYEAGLKTALQLVIAR